MATYTIIPSSLVQDPAFVPIPGSVEDQYLLHYTVQEGDGSEYRVSIVWNKRNRKTGKADYRGISLRKSKLLTLGYMKQAIFREKQAHNIPLTPAEKARMRYPGIAPRSRVRIKDAPITPAAIVASITILQDQVSKLTRELAALRAQLERATGDHAALLQLQLQTQAQLDRVTAALRTALTG